MYRNNLVGDDHTCSLKSFAHSLYQAALSQYRNLLFVAYLDEIHVSVPNFPQQLIPSKPKLVIQLPRSRPGLRGYLDPSRPHAVNHLIVGDLGDEEVVVVACDDGDVISYTVRSISLAISEGVETVHGRDASKRTNLNRYEHENCILPLADPNQARTCRLLAPWFHENVGASAWGLALHRCAKLLAVSSNSKNVNVFAPSLGPGPTISEIMERYTEWAPKGPNTLENRSIGKKFTLQGHMTNIPNVTFCDNALDPEGRFLASTDIDGSTMIWDIWQGAQISETIGTAGLHNADFPICPFSRRRRPDVRGWGVVCLDPRISRLRYVIQISSPAIMHVQFGKKGSLYLLVFFQFLYSFAVTTVQ